MPRLEQIDEAEADPIDRHGARLIDPGKKRALFHEGTLGRAMKIAQDLSYFAYIN